MKHRIQFYIEDEDFGIVQSYAEHQSRTVSNFFMHCALSEIRKRTKRQPTIKSYRTGDRKWPGYIYFIRRGEFVKIGLTINLENRIREIKRNSPETIIIIKFYETDDMVKEEIKWHHVFDSKRMTGEWFELDDDDAEYIRAKTPQYSRYDKGLLHRLLFLCDQVHNVGKSKQNK